MMWLYYLIAGIILFFIIIYSTVWYLTFNNDEKSGYYNKTKGYIFKK